VAPLTLSILLALYQVRDNLNQYNHFLNAISPLYNLSYGQTLATAFIQARKRQRCVGFTGAVAVRRINDYPGSLITQAAFIKGIVLYTTYLVHTEDLLPLTFAWYLLSRAIMA
jgi:hypothetical protein